MDATHPSNSARNQPAKVKRNIIIEALEQQERDLNYQVVKS